MSLQKFEKLNIVTQYLLQKLGYHVNFTRLCIMTEFSQTNQSFHRLHWRYKRLNVHKDQQLLCKNSFCNYGILHSTKLSQLRTDFYIWSTSGGKQYVSLIFVQGLFLSLRSFISLTVMKQILFVYQGLDIQFCRYCCKSAFFLLMVFYFFVKY